MRILVLGGTGVLGRRVVTHLPDRGHAVAVPSRRGGTPDPRTEGFAGGVLRDDTGVVRGPAFAEWPAAQPR